MATTIYGCVNRLTGEIDFDACDTADFSGCIVRSGEHAGQVELTISGLNCDDTYYGCVNRTTGKFQIIVPDDCCDICEYCCEDIISVRFRVNGGAWTTLEETVPCGWEWLGWIPPECNLKKQVEFCKQAENYKIQLWNIAEGNCYGGTYTCSCTIADSENRCLTSGSCVDNCGNTLEFEANY